MVTKTAVDIISDLTGVIKVLELSDEDRERIKKLEACRENDIIPVINKGLNECLMRDVCLLVVKNTKFRYPPTPTLLLVTDKGRILGQELISPEDRKKYQNRDDVYPLSKDFILFKSEKDLNNRGQEKQFFVLPSVPFPEIENIEGITDVVSSSPSTNCDEYLGEKYSYGPDPLIATLVVGFNRKRG